LSTAPTQRSARIWSWQQAVLATGVERQLRRSDFTEAARAALLEARARMREAMP
jgi:hypothetical protein